MRTIIGIIGTIGSGKDTAAEYISKKLNVPSFPISQVLKDFAKKLELEPNRENLIMIGNKLVAENGPGFAVENLMGRTSEKFAIITGIRRLEVIDYIKKNYNLILLAVSAQDEIRFEKVLVARNKLGEAKSFEKFIENEQKENSAPNTERLFECLKLADYTVDNNSDLETFFRKLDEFLVSTRLGKK